MSKQLRIWLFVLLGTLLTSTSLLAEGVITMTTSKRAGETISLSIEANGSVSITGVEESARTDGLSKEYTLTSKTITIRGDVTSLDCGAEEYRRWGLISLDVSGCTSLATLKCSNNPLTSLDVSGCTALTELNCSWNRLSSLDVSGCTSLTELNCSDNLLPSLDVSKNPSLTTLYCNNNQLTSLDVSGCTALTKLWCNNNQLTSLNVSGCTALKWLNCSINRLTSLDVSGCTSLTNLDCSRNQLTSLNLSKNTALTILDCSRNQINGENMTKLVNSLPDRKGMLWGGSLVIVNRSEDEKNLCRPSDIAIAQEKNWGPYWENGDPYEGIGEGVIIMTTSKAVGEKVKLRIVANGDVLIEGVSEKPYLSDRYSKNYRLTSQTITIRGDVTELDCDYNQLTSLDVSSCTALTKLDCSSNQPTSLNVSKNTTLTELYCYSNQLTSLDVSKNTALTILGCAYNQLTSLDVSGCTALTKLDCHYNQLTSLNVSKNTTLTELYCDSNQLTSLDVSKNTALTTLWCSSYQLTSLDVSKNTALTTLYCYENQLTSLDVSKNTALTKLNCYSNQLTSLDLSKNTALTELNCNSNQLTSLNVSGCTALTELYCNNNQLTSLNLSNCRGLETLKSYGNKFDNGAIHQLISSLPNRKGIGVGKFYVIDRDNNNTCYQYDVDLAKKKFWLLYHEAGALYLGEPNPTFALTYEPTISGGSIIIKGADDLQHVVYGTELTINATPAEGYELTALTANGRDILATKKVVVTENMTIKATFAKKHLKVSTEKVGEGLFEVTGADDLNSVLYGTELTVSVTPATGYELTLLMANDTDISATKKVIVKENMTIKATFTKKAFAVTLSKEGEGTLATTGAEDLKAVPYGTEVTIVATPATGYELKSIEANGTDITATKKVVVREAVAVKATFVKKTFAVELTKMGEGTLAASGAEDLSAVPYGTKLTITATPAEGYELVALVANNVDISDTKSIEVTESMTIKATFAKKNFAVTFDKEGEGTITAAGADDLNAVAYGTELTIVATPAAGYELQSLVAGGVDITATKKIVVKDNLTVKATFAKKNFAVSLTKEGEGTITATGATSLDAVAYGTELTINATPAEGYELTALTANGTDILASKKVIVKEAVEVKATFAKKSFAVSLTKEGEGTLVPSGAEDLSAVPYGTQLTITATPAEGYELVALVANNVDISDTKSIEVTESMTIKATFAKKNFTITFDKEGEGTITATGAEDLNAVAYGTELTIVATPAEGYELQSLVAGGVDITATKKIVVKDNLTVKATFAKKSFAVSLTKEGEGTITATGATSLNAVAYGTELAIVATPAKGYELTALTANGTDILASKKVVVTDNMTVKATFAKKNFAVSLTKEGEGTITATGATSLNTVAYGTELTINATPAEGYELTALTANGTDILATKKVVVEGNLTVKATFAKKNFAVTFEKVGEGTITATGATSLDAVAYGTELTIVATPAEGYELVSITANGTDITASKKVVVTGNLTVKATFEKKSFAVSLTKEGEGTITATGASNLNSVAYGTELTIVATPAKGYELVSITAGGADITATKKIVVKDNLTVKATFAKKSFAVTFAKEGEGTVTATGADDLNAVAYGTELTIVATPAAGYELQSLVADGVDITATKKIVVKDNLTIKATFTKKTFAVTLTSNEHGDITIVEPVNLEAVSYGTTLTVKATGKNAQCELTALTANGKDILATKSFVVTGPTEVKATFVDHTGVTTTVTQQVKLYPNPATDYVIVEGVAPASEVTLHSMTGERLYAGRADDRGTLQIDLTPYADGVYLVCVAGETYRVVVRH